MTTDDKKIVRKLSGLLIAVLSYYVVHEGAHLIYALSLGTFKQINFIGMGVQIETYKEQMSQLHTALFCLAGVAATTIAAWALLFMTKRILKCPSLAFKAASFYVTLAFLLNDPFYLSVLYPYVGGGDMNGIKLLLPENFARAAFALLFLIHCVVIVKFVYPSYKAAFLRTAPLASE